jgi:hypothetical protein
LAKLDAVLRPAHKHRVHALDVATRPLCIRPGLGGGLPPLRQGTRFQRRHPSGNPVDAGSVLVPLRLQQIEARGAAQQLLVEHLDLGAQGPVAGLQLPASGLCKLQAVLPRRAGLGSVGLQGHRDGFALSIGLDEALADDCGAALLCCELRLQIVMPRLDRGQVRAFLL